MHLLKRLLRKTLFQNRAAEQGRAHTPSTSMATDATGTMTDEDMTYDVAKDLTSNAFKRDGYTFEGWNTKADGSGTTYTDAEEVKNLTVTGENGGKVTLYAQWKNAEPAVPTTTSGSVTVTKNVATQTGESANVSGTFYFALFSDAACTKAVTKPQSVTVTNGVSASTTFTNLAQGTYYAAETNADGTKAITTPEDADNYTGYGVDGNGTQITISAGSLTGNAEITNRYTPTGNSTPISPTSPKSPVISTTSKTPAGSSPQTGDGFDAGLWALFMLFSA